MYIIFIYDIIYVIIFRLALEDEVSITRKVFRNIFVSQMKLDV